MIDLRAGRELHQLSQRPAAVRCISQTGLDVVVNRGIQIDPASICRNACDQGDDRLGLPGVERGHSIHQGISKALANFASIPEDLHGKGAIDSSIAQRRLQLVRVYTDCFWRRGRVLIGRVHVTARGATRICRGREVG